MFSLFKTAFCIILYYHMLRRNVNVKDFLLMVGNSRTGCGAPSMLERRLDV